MGGFLARLRVGHDEFFHFAPPVGHDYRYRFTVGRLALETPAKQTEIQAMTIRKCPHCAQLLHFDGCERALVCWNCWNFSALPTLATPGEKRIHRAIANFDRALPHPSRLVRAAKIALVVAVPVAAMMLLVCNGFDIFVVRDMTAPFLTR